MKLLVVVLSLLAMAIANDDHECHDECVRKFNSSEISIESCDYGCSQRDRLLLSMFGAITCRNACYKKYHVTGGDVKPCNYACYLPYASVTRMSITNDNGQRKVEVVSHSGIKLAKNFVSSESAEDSSDSEEDFKPIVSDFDINFDPRVIFQKMMNERPRIALFEAGPSHRPSGHDGFSEETVFNVNKNGEAILTERSKIIRNWQCQTLLTLAMIFVLSFSIIYMVLFFVRKCTCGYSRLAFIGEGAKLAAPSKVVVSDTKWTEQEPSGDAPPAYDQLSLHLKEDKK